jgi:hypothetical protein
MVNSVIHEVPIYVVSSIPKFISLAARIRTLQDLNINY